MRSSRLWLGVEVSILLIALSLLGSPIAMADIFEAKVTAKSLNIRSKPTSGSEVIGSLSRGQTIIVYKASVGWLGVSHKGGIGYVSAKYVEIVGPLSADTEEDCEVDFYDVTLDYSVDSFKCREGILSDGYEECSLYVRILASSTCDSSFSVGGSCDVSYKVVEPESAVSIGNNRSEFHQFFFYANNGSGSAFEEISWRPARMMETVIGVEVKNVSCSISAVYGQ
jgi:uncharacterized protein YraI